MLDRLPMTGTLEALAVLAARRAYPVPGSGEAIMESARVAASEAAPAADPDTLTWPQLLAAAARLGFTVVNLDPAGRVPKASRIEADEDAPSPAREFDAAVETLKAALVGVIVQADAPGGIPLAGVLAAVPVKEGVLAVVVRSLHRKKDGTLAAQVSEPGYPDVQYMLDGICIVGAAACRMPAP